MPRSRAVVVPVALALTVGLTALQPAVASAGSGSVRRFFSRAGHRFLRQLRPARRPIKVLGEESIERLHWRGKRSIEDIRKNGVHPGELRTFVMSAMPDVLADMQVTHPGPLAVTDLRAIYRLTPVQLEAHTQGRAVLAETSKQIRRDPFAALLALGEVGTLASGETAEDPPPGKPLSIRRWGKTQIVVGGIAIEVHPEELAGLPEGPELSTATHQHVIDAALRADAALPCPTGCAPWLFTHRQGLPGKLHPIHQVSLPEVLILEGGKTRRMFPLLPAEVARWAQARKPVYRLLAYEVATAILEELGHAAQHFAEAPLSPDGAEFEHWLHGLSEARVDALAAEILTPKQAETLRTMGSPKWYSSRKTALLYEFNEADILASFDEVGLHFHPLSRKSYPVRSFYEFWRENVR